MAAPTQSKAQSQTAAQPEKATAQPEKAAASGKATQSQTAAQPHDKHEIEIVSTEEKVRDTSKAPVVLKVDHVHKMFRLPTEQATGLKQAFINWTRGIRGYKEQHVLKDVSFEVHQGDFFGIVGRNGGGKSTLLKIISGIYVPEKGTIDVRGKLVPFIELGVGFNPELTGRENVYLNGALLGFTRDEIDAMYDDIVEFAELGEFMDQKLKNYSSGMQVRLAFSVAIKAQGDILVLDEVLAVGDEAFQRKCDDFFTQIRKDPTKTVILVTHNMASVKRYCNRAMFIQDGKVAVIGDKETVAERYTLANLEAAEKEEAAKKKAEKARDTGEYPNGLNERCPILRTFPVSKPMLTSKDVFRFGVEYQYDEPGDFYLAIAMHDIRRGGITYDTGAKTFRMKKHGHHKVYFEIPLDLFNDGEFRLFTSLRTPSPTVKNMTDAVAVALDDNACNFVIRDKRNRTYALLSDRALEIHPVAGVDVDGGEPVNGTQIVRIKKVYDEPVIEGGTEAGDLSAKAASESAASGAKPAKAGSKKAASSEASAK